MSNRRLRSSKKHQESCSGVSGRFGPSLRLAHFRQVCPLFRREVEIRIGSIAVEKLAVIANGFTCPERLPQIRAYAPAFPYGLLLACT